MEMLIHLFVNNNLEQKRRQIKIEVLVHGRLDAELSAIDNQLTVDLNIVDVIGIQDYIRNHTYTDTYTVDSSFDDTVLPTKNKFMSDDVTIHKIEQYETSNESGGYTLYIGQGDPNG